MDLGLYSKLEVFASNRIKLCLLAIQDMPRRYKTILSKTGDYRCSYHVIIAKTRNRIITHLLFLIYARTRASFSIDEYVDDNLSILLQSRLNQSLDSIQSFFNDKKRKDLNLSVDIFLSKITSKSRIYHGFPELDSIGTKPPSFYQNFVIANSLSNEYFQHTITAYFSRRNLYRVSEYIKEELQEGEKKRFIQYIPDGGIEYTFYMSHSISNTDRSQITRKVYTIQTDYIREEIDKAYSDAVENFIVHTIEYRVLENVEYRANGINIIDRDDEGETRNRAKEDSSVPLTMCFVRCIENHRFFGKCAFLDAWATNSSMNTFAKHINNPSYKRYTQFPTRYGILSLYRTLLALYNLGYRQIVAEVVAETVLNYFNYDVFHQLRMLHHLYLRIGFTQIGLIETSVYNCEELKSSDVEFVSKRTKPGQVVEKGTFPSERLDDTKHIQRNDMLLFHCVIDENFIVNRCIPMLLAGEVENIDESAIMDFLLDRHNKPYFAQGKVNPMF